MTPLNRFWDSVRKGTSGKGICYSLCPLDRVRYASNWPRNRPRKRTREDEKKGDGGTTSTNTIAYNTHKENAWVLSVRLFRLSIDTGDKSIDKVSPTPVHEEPAVVKAGRNRLCLSSYTQETHFRCRIWTRMACWMSSKICVTLCSRTRYVMFTKLAGSKCEVSVLAREETCGLPR
jgi:hypothetical protein